MNRRRDHLGPAPERGVTSTRDRNRGLIYSLVRRHGPVARKDLAEWTLLTKATITEIVDELVTAGVLEEVGFAPSSSAGGRRPRLLAVRADSHFVAGVHVGVQRMTVALADPLGNELGLLATHSRRQDPSGTLAEASTLLTRLLEDNQVPRDRLVGVGVTLPGLVDWATGNCELAPNLGWENVPVRDILEERTGAQVFVHNTAQAIAAAEIVDGELTGERDVVVLYVGTGVGAGVLVGGKVFHGRSGFAGEIGHCVVAGADEICSCGKRGCLETVVAAPALVKSTRRQLTAGTPSVLAGRRALTTKVIAKAAEQGDDLARSILTDAGGQLGVAASWLVNLFNPAALLVAGGVSEIGDLVLSPLRQSLLEGAMPQTSSDLVIRRASLGERGKIRGAVLLALQALDDTPRPIFQGIGGPGPRETGGQSPQASTVSA